MTLKNLSSKLWEPVNSTGLDVFRKLFAILIIIQIWAFVSADLLNKTFVLTRATVPFDFSAWVPVLPGKMIQLTLFIQFLGAILLFTDKYARQGALIYFISFGYIFVLDASYYNNHFYFILLLCLFYVFYKPEKINGTNSVPKLLLYLFQFQVIVVYFFGGVAKINPDWLFHQEPMREMLRHSNSHHWPESVVYFFTYAGLVFDLLIGFLLLFRRTLKLGIVLNVLFHLSNHFIFSSGASLGIGAFPFFMISTNLLFIDPIKLQSWLKEKFPFYQKNKDLVKKKAYALAAFALPEKRKAGLTALALIFVALQILVPLRHYLIPGNTDWTGEGWYFSWRMKVRSKKTSNTIVLKDKDSGKEQVINPYQFLNSLQYSAACEDPALMHHFVQTLKKRAYSLGIKNPEFRLSWICSMNSRPRQAVVDSTIDFGSLSHKKFGHDDWILPLSK